jgi:glycine/D-amino acid oxidase-like deaminating enzyme
VSASDPLDVVIVGAGIAGLSLAFELTRRSSIRVAVIAPSEHVAGSATPVAQGISAIKGLLLAREPLFHAKLSAHRFLPAWLAEVSASAGLSIAQNHCGVGELCPDLPAYQGVAGRIFQRRFHGAFGVLAGTFGEAKINGLLYPGDFWFDPRGLLDALEEALCRTRGEQVTRIRARVVSLSSGEPTQAKLDDGSSIFARHVVLANGWQAPQLLASAPASVRLLTIPGWKEVPGQTIEWAPPSGRTFVAPYFQPGERLVSSFVRGTKSVTLTPAGNIFAGSWEGDEQDFLPGVAQEASLFLPAADLQNSSVGASVTRSGIRLRCKDRAPVCGPVSPDGRKGIWLFTGFYKNGLQLAPWLAGRVADALLAGNPDGIPVSFSTCRFF